MEQEVTNEIEYAHSQFRDDLTIEGTPIKIEIRGEVYKNPIHPARNGFADINTWIAVIQHNPQGDQFESGHEFYEGKMDEGDLKQRVAQLLENPFERMYPQYTEKYDVNKTKLN